MKLSLSLLLLAVTTLTVTVDSSNSTDDLCLAQGSVIENNTRILAAADVLTKANSAGATKCFTGSANNCVVNASSQLAQFDSVCVSQNGAVSNVPVTYKCADNASHTLTFSMTYALCHGINCSSSFVDGALNYISMNASDSLNAALQSTGIACNYTTGAAATSGATRMVSWAATALVALTSSVLVML
jgi:hypothetical protein